ncbi:hypothetical protein [Pedobacter agri]|uniref:hypothetical protein n=1 Tax=Pedobacter agri TaxID=454586 RepID=UPI002930D471|nr:hypothetical protein [Pedobacter agri]
MKPTIKYTVKVCLVTLFASLPVTLAIGWTYISLILLSKPTNYNFNFHLPFSDIFTFTAIIAIAMTYSSYSAGKFGKKKFINDRPVVHSIVIFLCYLSFSKRMQVMGFDQLLFSYTPMFLMAYLCSHIFSTHKDELAWAALNISTSNDLKSDRHQNPFAISEQKSIYSEETSSK